MTFKTTSINMRVVYGWRLVKIPETKGYIIQILKIRH